MKNIKYQQLFISWRIERETIDQLKLKSLILIFDFLSFDAKFEDIIFYY
jgi:hypothetical protein